eukprot:4250939-Pyramimonas_sp.AAC.1
MASTLAGGKRHGGITAYLLAHRDPYYDPYMIARSVNASATRPGSGIDVSVLGGPNGPGQC